MFSFVRIKYGENATDTVTGVIIYPDDFSFSEAGVASIAFGARPVTQINAADWAALEEAGCVFLPTTRYRNMTATGNLEFTTEEDWGNRAYYFSATAINAQYASNVFFGLHFSGQQLQTNYTTTARWCGLYVRLVQDL